MVVPKTVLKVLTFLICCIRSEAEKNAVLEDIDFDSKKTCYSLYTETYTQDFKEGVISYEK